EAFAAFESDVEKLVRASIARGTVHVTIRLERVSEAGRYRIDPAALQSYVEQARAASADLGMPLARLDHFLGLPGVIIEKSCELGDESDDWPLVESAVQEALEKLNSFRRSEGAAMADDLRANLALIATELDAVAENAPIEIGR